MSDIYIPQPRSKLDTVAKALGIAQSVYGIKSAMEQSELNDLKIKEYEDAKEKQKKSALYSAAGIMEPEKFNKDYMIINPERYQEISQKTGMEINPIKMKVLNPLNKDQGYDDVLALPKTQVDNINKVMAEMKIAQMRIDADKKGKAGTGGLIPKGSMLKTDEQMAKNLANYYEGGGSANDQSRIDNLNNIIVDANNVFDESFSQRAGAALVPDSIGALIMPNYKDLENRFYSEAQKSLKEILGGQFGEKEGFALLSRAMSGGLTKEQKISAMTDFKNFIQRKSLVKRASMDYFAQNGTMQGFDESAVEKAIVLNLNKGKSNKNKTEDEKPVVQSKSLPGESEAQADRSDKEFMKYYLTNPRTGTILPKE